MTEKICFTVNELACLFLEGVNRGQSEASSFEWSTRIGSRWEEAFADALETLVNDNKAWNAEDRISRETIETWIKDRK
jgi:hypothetical protein